MYYDGINVYICDHASCTQHNTTLLSRNRTNCEKDITFCAHMQNQIDIIQTTNFKIYIVPLCDHNMHGLILSHYAG